MDNDVRAEAGRLAAAIKNVLEADIDGLPDLPVRRRQAAQSTPVARPRPQQSVREPGPPQPPLNTPSPAPVPIRMRQPEPPAPAPRDDFAATLPADIAGLREAVAECRRCRLADGRTNTVFGEGPMNPLLMIVGEAPASIEDQSGRPFCGEAGELLTKIVGAMGIDRESQCYLTTVVKCRTPDESTPTPDTVGLCRPFLQKQIALVRPRFIMAMGQTAATVLAGSPSISRLRGRFLMHDDIPMLVTYHPAALLKEPGLKKLVWEDVKLIMARMKG